MYKPPISLSALVVLNPLHQSTGFFFIFENRISLRSVFFIGFFASSFQLLTAHDSSLHPFSAFLSFYLGVTGIFWYISYKTAIKMKIWLALLNFGGVAVLPFYRLQLFS